MPYITDAERKRLYEGVRPYSAGTLVYTLTGIIVDFLEIHKKNFETYNTVVGALETVKTEFQRRVLHPYEDKKMIENGDVYTHEDINV